MKENTLNINKPSLSNTDMKKKIDFYDSFWYVNNMHVCLFTLQNQCSRYRSILPRNRVCMYCYKEALLKDRQRFWGSAIIKLYQTESRSAYKVLKGICLIFLQIFF